MRLDHLQHTHAFTTLRLGSVAAMKYTDTMETANGLPASLDCHCYCSRSAAVVVLSSLLHCALLWRWHCCSCVRHVLLCRRRDDPTYDFSSRIQEPSPSAPTRTRTQRPRKKPKGSALWKMPQTLGISDQRRGSVLQTMHCSRSVRVPKLSDLNFIALGRVHCIARDKIAYECSLWRIAEQADSSQGPSVSLLTLHRANERC